IAFERAELRRQLTQVNAAARLPNLLRGVIGGNLGQALFGAAGPAGQGGWVALALSLLRRYRVAAALLGSAAPMLRGRGGWRRVVRVGVLAAAAYFGWRLVQGHERQR
ncbi:MAG TPA: hypothetical protein VFA35_10305, partial [Burkholderiaceae bacterium]|nr:hypothetical protein [Burkholderiaceae bacterium]